MFADRGELLCHLPLREPATAVAAQDDRTALLAAAGALRVIDRRGVETERWPLPDPAAKITALAAGGDHVVAAELARRQVYVLGPAGKLRCAVPGQTGGAFRGFVPGSAGLDLAAGSGTFWVSNPARLRVERFDADGRHAGQIGGRSGGTPSRFTGPQNPVRLAALPDGVLATLEVQPLRIRLWSPSGELLGTALGPESLGPGAVHAGLAADGQGRLLVFDSDRRVVRRFRPRSATPSS
jgi:hypothetical protein